jgi:eukaryotic-like serine/threonine-protein kinase
MTLDSQGPLMLSAGDRLGPYTIAALLGQGGMGEVYRAIDTRLDRTVAVKILPHDVADSAARRVRFEREAHAISRLSHPHICSLYDVGEHQDTPFLVMEYLQGETLDHRLMRGALPIDQVLQYAVEIADALDHAHRQGIVHRDLKPSNIMLTRSGVKLLDFGVAKLRTAGAGDPALAPTGPVQTITEEGAIVGTLQYMAPEQLEGRETDSRADIFAFGAIVYEMTTGRAAFEGASRASTIAAILERDPVPLSGVRPEAPPLLTQLITRCLAKNASERWQTAGDLKQALTWMSGGSAIAPAASTPRRWWKHPVSVAAAAVVAAAGVAGIGYTVAHSRRGPEDIRPYRFLVPPPENTNFSQSSAFMTVSPDGHSIAFLASSRAGDRQLWIRSLDAVNARPLSGTETAAQPFWSPDSRSLAFVALASATLKKIDVVNGVPLTITGLAGHGAWNKDGVILFQGGEQAGARGISRVAAGGGPVTPATSLDPALAEIRHAWPEFLPDSRHFLFVARSSLPEHDGDIYVGSLDSTDRVRVLNADSHAVYAPPGYLLFMRVNTLLAQPFDPTTFRLTGEPVPVAEQVERTPGSHRGAFSVSSTGVLAYRSIGETRLAWYDRSGKMLQTIGPAGYYANPALSPDERRLAVERLNQETGEPDIWVIDLAREGAASRFTFNATPDKMPLWSTDGSRIVFKSGGGFHQKPSNGTGAEEGLLANAGPFVTPLDWSHDGGSLIYQSAVGGPDRANLSIWMLPLAGDRRPVAVLQRQQFHQALAHLSPNGRWLAYVSGESGRNEVYVRAFPSGEDRRQVSTQGGLEPAWRGDGKELFYLALDHNLMSAAVKPGPAFETELPKPLFETRTSALLNAGYTRNQYLVSADGQRFLVNQPPAGGSDSPITVVVHWDAGLKK